MLEGGIHQAARENLERRLREVEAENAGLRAELAEARKERYEARRELTRLRRERGPARREALLDAAEGALDAWPALRLLLDDVEAEGGPQPAAAAMEAAVRALETAVVACG